MLIKDDNEPALNTDPVITEFKPLDNPSIENIIEDERPQSIIKEEYEEVKESSKPVHHHKKPVKAQIFFTPNVLREFGMDYCRCIIIFMNPVLYRRYLNQIMN